MAKKAFCKIGEVSFKLWIVLKCFSYPYNYFRGPNGGYLRKAPVGPVFCAWVGCGDRGWMPRNVGVLEFFILRDILYIFIPRREERSEPNGVHLTVFPI